MSTWKPFSEFVQEQIDCVRQTEQNLLYWEQQRKTAMQRGDSTDAKRLEKLIDVSKTDMYMQVAAIKQLAKGR